MLQLTYMLVALVSVHLAVPAQSQNPLVYSNGKRTNYSPTLIWSDDCYMRLCTTAEHCCSQSDCLKLDDAIGYCFHPRAEQLGERCTHDGDCDGTLLCRRHHQYTFGRCHEKDFEKIQYGAVCSISAECDFRKGLCCKLQRRHRQKPRNVCSYFQDPLTCIGIVPHEAKRYESDSLTQAEQRTVGYDLQDI